MKDNASTYDAGTRVMLTVKGQIALAADALAAAGKTRNEQRRLDLCAQALKYLRPVVQA